MRVAVAGATGLLGAPVARRLREDGFDVRALVREPAAAVARLGAAVETVSADVTRPGTLDAALEGCDALYVSLRGRNDVGSYETIEVAGVRNLAAAARRAGVGRIAYISGAGRTVGNARHFPVRVKQTCERILQECGTPFTIFRPTHFMESLPMFVQRGRATVLGRQPHRYHYIAAADYAGIVSRALREPLAANRTFTVLGPQAFTMREALERFVPLVHPGMPIGQLPLPMARIIATVSRNPDLRFAAEIFAAFAAMGEDGDSAETTAILGPTTTTLEAWCRQYAASRAAATAGQA